MTTVDLQEPITDLPAPTSTPTPTTTPTRGRHLRLVPDTEPRQLSLAYEYEVGPGVPAEPAVLRHLSVVPDSSTEEQRRGLPPIGPWAAQLARAVAEVASGERPPGQLSMHITRDQLTRLTARGRAVARHPSSRHQRSGSRLQKVSSVRICPVAPGIVEASAVLIGEQRSQAIALRLEAMGSRWIATVVDLI